MDEKRSSSRCFRGHNLHSKVPSLCTLPRISFFHSIKFFIFFKLKRIYAKKYYQYYAKKIYGHHARLKENEHLFRNAQCNTEESPNHERGSAFQSNDFTGHEEGAER